MTGWITAGAMAVLAGTLALDNYRLREKCRKLVKGLARECFLRLHYQDIARSVSPIRRIK